MADMICGIAAISRVRPSVGQYVIQFESDLCENSIYLDSKMTSLVYTITHAMHRKKLQ